ncbi:MAG: class I SAM-dependent methyltransferase [Dehalococcoidia bacterium]|nr:class I SAM-dependent methyltransferase [Dehalococcoidia bacterium]MCB9486181.1 class I SAM-dependent methyltransferase [Thermoflexaceae bacterium]
MQDPYAVDAAYYDLIHEDVDDDIGLWLSFAGRTTLPFLEIGAGSGRISVALAQAGHAVTALDPSPSMLTLAKSRADAAGVPLELVHATLHTARLESGRFGVVLFPADVFLYAADAGEQALLLAAAATVVHFSGLVILDLPGPALGLDPSSNGDLLLAWSGETADGDELEVWHVHEDNLADQTRTLRVRYERTAPDGALFRETTIHSLRYVHPQECRHLLERAGLQVTDVFGDYELGPLTNDSARMIVCARRIAG